MKSLYQNLNSGILLLIVHGSIMNLSCEEGNTNQKGKLNSILKEKQITFSQKNHALDNNDNFSPDGKSLCYDTRGTVYNQNLANCKSIEKVDISTGVETVLWEPPSITGEQAAPGVAAVSYHPKENKVIFIHGPLLEEVNERGYYGIRNRTGVIVSADGKGQITKADLRDVITNRSTIPGAQRGGTHRHEYARDGHRIGFTYDDYFQTNYDRTIGYMEKNKNSPEGYSHFFAVLLKPAKKGASKPGEIEKATGDSWVDFKGSKRAFIGKVRAKNGIDYENSLFIAEIPEDVDVTTSFSGTMDEYPLPPKGIVIKRLTHSTKDEGIVRGSLDGKRIAYLSEDKNGIKQVFVIPVDGSDLDNDPKKQPIQVSRFKSNVSDVRWHPSNDWIFAINDGNVVCINVSDNKEFGTSVFLTEDKTIRNNLVVSPDGNVLAYNKEVPISIDAIKANEASKKEFIQVFVLELDWLKINTDIK